MSDEPIWIVTRDDADSNDSEGGKGWKENWTQKASSILHLKPIDPGVIKSEMGTIKEDKMYDG